MLPDSGGAGEFRGGLGQRIELVNDSGSRHDDLVPRRPHAVRAGRRPRRQARGLREIRINGEIVHPKGRYVLKPGDRVTTLEAGGGGYGDPRKRSREAIIADCDAGFVTRAAALRDYGVEVGED